METNTKQRLRVLHLQLGNLLTQKKALNSKVTTRHFELFRDAVDADADPYDIKARLTRLEQSLKQEGLYKNVKSDFVHLRKDILGSLNWTETAAQGHHNHHKQTLPGINNMPKDRTFYVAPKNSSDDHAATAGPSQPKHSNNNNTLSTDDMRMLNTAIGKLYRHLQLNQRDQEVTSSDVSHKEANAQKENILTLSQLHHDESLHEIVLKIRNFEKEFQRQKVLQQREAIRLQEEIKRLNKNALELRKENERMKGVQPIVTKAKGKQVERIEERHRTEKKGMEEKIYELESGMRKTFAQQLHDQEEIRSHIRTDVETFALSLNNIHYMVLGYHHESNKGANNKTSTDNPELSQAKDLLNMLTRVADGVKTLKHKNQDLNIKVEDLKHWRSSLKELDREITRFGREYSDDDDKYTRLSYETDPQEIVSNCRNKLLKTKENISTKMKDFGDASSVIKRKERDLSKHRRGLKELQNEISKLHEHVMSVQMEDISISMPDFDRLDGGMERSEGSADELPEADQQEQVEQVHKLKQIGTMVNHYQLLIIDRTSILNKMENDMLPLKIRVNRLHDEISKAMTSPESPDREPSDDVLRTRRSFSPDVPTSTISREIANMLKKLSKMELTIRHLVETYSSDYGRASV